MSLTSVQTGASDGEEDDDEIEGEEEENEEDVSVGSLVRNYVDKLCTRIGKDFFSVVAFRNANLIGLNSHQIAYFQEKVLESEIFPGQLRQHITFLKKVQYWQYRYCITIKLSTKD